MTIKFWQVGALVDRSTEAKPGTVLTANAEGVTIVYDVGVLHVTQLQEPDSKRLPAHEFL